MNSFGSRRVCRREGAGAVTMTTLKRSSVSSLVGLLVSLLSTISLSFPMCDILLVEAFILINYFGILTKSFFYFNYV